MEIRTNKCIPLELKYRALLMASKIDKSGKKIVSIQEISRRLGICRKSIYNFFKKYEETQSLIDKWNTFGRPRKTSIRTDKVILKMVKDNPKISTGEIARFFKRKSC